jgi:hypothetical protein
LGPTYVDLSLPLDECALLVQHCSNLGPLLSAVADWAAAGLSDTALLRPAIKQYMMDEISSAGRSANKVLSDGPRRRTLLPMYIGKACVPQLPGLSGLGAALDSKMYVMSVSSKALTPDVFASIGHTVFEVATQVASSCAIKQGSQTFDALAQATIYAGELEKHIHRMRSV